jgi:hypothetical protein
MKVRITRGGLSIGLVLLSSGGDRIDWQKSAEGIVGLATEPKAGT